jgi:hypothetical protein
VRTFWTFGAVTWPDVAGQWLVEQPACSTNLCSGKGSHGCLTPLLTFTGHSPCCQHWQGSVCHAGHVSVPAPCVFIQQTLISPVPPFSPTQRCDQHCLRPFFSQGCGHHKRPWGPDPLCHDLLWPVWAGLFLYQAWVRRNPCVQEPCHTQPTYGACVAMRGGRRVRHSLRRQS